MYNLGKVLSLSESHLYNFFIDLNEDNLIKAKKVFDSIGRFSKVEYYLCDVTKSNDIISAYAFYRGISVHMRKKQHTPVLLVTPADGGIYKHLLLKKNLFNMNNLIKKDLKY